MATIKLRVRPASGGPTVKVELPLLCSLEALKNILGPLISLPSSSISLSLNKNDVIEGPGNALLSSLGITNGDLLFYIENPGSGSAIKSNRSLGTESVVARVQGSVGAVVGESSQGAGTSREVRARLSATIAPSSVSIGEVESELEQTAPSSRAGRALSTPNTRRELCAAAAARRASREAAEHMKSSVLGTNLSNVHSAPSSSVASLTILPNLPDRTMSTEGNMESGAGGVGVDTSRGGNRLVPIPDLLQRVLNREIGNTRDAFAYLVLSVHAVMLETGFVRVDTGSSTRTVLEGYELPLGWNLSGLVNLTYTLPELADSSSGRAIGLEALLRCQVVGNALVVYGAVTGGSVYRLSLSASRFLRESFNKRKFEESNKQSDSDLQEDQVSRGESNHSSVSVVSRSTETAGENIFRDFFELWKEVKDFLSVPLLTAMCEKAGLPPPPSLLRLPTELKIKVLDSLSAVALGLVSCACSELRFLAASEDLWKQMYKKEFGVINSERVPGGRGWKSAFVLEFKQRNRREEERREIGRQFRAEELAPDIIFRHFTNPYRVDHFQGLGGRPSFGGGFGGGPFVGDIGGSGEFRRYRSPEGENSGGSLGGGLNIGADVDEDSGSFPILDFDSHVLRGWPSSDL